MAAPSIKKPKKELLKAFGIADPDDLLESNTDYIWEAGNWAYQEALKEGQTEAQAEKERVKAEMATSDAIYHAWENAFEDTIEWFYNKVDLNIEKYKDKKLYGFYKVTPNKSWKTSANLIREIINGVGYFYFGNLKEFLDSGPYSPRIAVQHHLNWIPDWSDVYEGSKSSHYFDKNLRDQMRNL